MRSFCHPNRAFRIILLLVLPATVGAALPAAAQADWQVYGGTSFLWVRNSSSTLQPLNLGTLNEWGWQTDITQYPWRWFGATVESSGFYARPSLYDPTNQQSYGNLFNVKSYTMMFGPSFAYRRNPHVEPFGHVLAGAVNQQCTLIHSYDACRLFNGQSGGYSQWIFGWSLGGGADIKISKLVAIRGQMDWLPTTFKNLYNDRQNNYRVSVGLVFRFGDTGGRSAHLKTPEPTPSAQSAGEESGASTTGARNVADRQSPAPVQASGATPAPITPVPVTPAPVASSTASAQPPSSASETARVSAPQPAPTAAPAQDKAEASSLQPGGGTSHEAAVVPAPPSSSSPAAGNATPAKPSAAPATPEPARPAAGVAPAAGGPAPATPAMVEFWSSPTGADIQIDGQYVGSTYSIIAVPPGEHTITISKEDFAKWERTMLVGEGSIRVAAYLERVRATITFH
jgi:hypothetical protein